MPDDIFDIEKIKKQAFCNVMQKLILEGIDVSKLKFEDFFSKSPEVTQT